MKGLDKLGYREGVSGLLIFLVHCRSLCCTFKKHEGGQQQIDLEAILSQLELVAPPHQHVCTNHERTSQLHVSHPLTFLLLMSHHTKPTFEQWEFRFFTYVLNWLHGNIDCYHQGSGYQCVAVLQPFHSPRQKLCSLKVLCRYLFSP